MELTRKKRLRQLVGSRLIGFADGRHERRGKADEVLVPNEQGIQVFEWE